MSSFYFRLLYTPCVDCSGTEIIRIILSENQTDPNIPVASLPVTLTVTITSQNDHPEIFITQYGQSMLHQDPSEPVIVYLEQMQDYNENIWSDQFTAVIGGYDVEKEDNLSMVISYPNHGNLTVTNEETILLRIDTCQEQSLMDTNPCGNFSQLLPYNETKMSWIYVTVTYIQPSGYFGYDRLKMYVMDNNNSSSEILTVEFAIMESPCQNNGHCQTKNTSNYPCEDTHRAESFDQYYDCVCSSGYTGQHCEEDVNECLQTPSPCPESYTCINTIGSHICTCPDCGIQPWMIAVIVICIIVILISAAIVVFFLRKKLRPDKWVYKSDRGHSEKARFDEDIDEEDLSSENEDPVIPEAEVPRYQRQTVSFQMKTKNKFQFESHVPPPRQSKKHPGKLTSETSHATPWKPLPHIKEMPFTNTLGQKKPVFNLEPVTSTLGQKKPVFNLEPGTSTLGQKKPVFNLELLNSPNVSRPVTVASIGNKGELPIVDEGGCFRESSLLSIESNMFPSDVCKQEAPAVKQTTGLDENLISFVVDSLNEETSA
ncbi:Hypothetical predicted protein [Mytilus galloprovincialis]|uniref:EGF-like domain-containing protein n=1 Tax=Mytilus galloprovincialis TaxID=29158 RepID=A0A8B6ESW1_MYTGA|nr:Hypothetical predicted protein [Mytilus galloprovincialis]